MTGKQIRIFWGEFRSACDALGLAEKAEQEAYRAAIMLEEAGAEHLRDVSPTTGFEALMIRLATDSGDYSLASRYAIGGERRIGAMIDDCAAQVFALAGKTGTPSDRLAYVLAILDQSGIHQARTNSRVWWMDLSETRPVKIFAMLDTHRRRLIRRRNSTAATAIPLRYQFGRTYPESEVK